MHREFKYTIDHNVQENSWNFRVYTIDDTSNDFFESTVKLINDNTVQKTSIQVNDRKQYGAKGIPDSLIPKISEVLNKILISSPSQHEDSSIYRTADATKMWEQLRRKKIAEYDTQRDIYYVVPKKLQCNFLNKAAKKPKGEN